MKNRILILLICLFAATSIFAEESSAAPTGVLEYFDDDLEIQVFDSDGIQIPEVFLGMELNEGDRIKTQNTYAELSLNPNGTIIKLSYNTDFTIEALQRDEGSANQFTLLTGKLRTVAAKSGIFKNNYSIQTPSAVCGVRGTDFGLEAAEGIIDSAFVMEGVVEFTSLVNGQTLELTAGMKADVYAEVFEPVRLPQPELESLFSDLQFTALDPANVPGSPLAKVEEPAPVVEPEPEPVVEAPPAVVEPEPVVEPVVEAPPAKEGPFYSWMKQNLGMEIGTLTIEGVTYSKAVLQPIIPLGKLRIGLYLPIIYMTNMFDSTDWYDPDGNSEWSFGTDQEGPWHIAKDVFRDTMLKLKFLEYGELRDPFYVKAGNLKTMTIGHGTLMNNYANDLEFPAVRKLGFNMGVNRASGGFEFVSDDLSDPDIVGGRAYIRPVGKLGFGFSTIADLNPEEGMEEIYALTATDYGYLGDPVFLTTAVDFDLPVAEGDAMSVILFTDVATMIPYYRESPDGYPTMSQGLAVKSFYNADASSLSDKFSSWGLIGGIMGNASIFDYRLEYRQYKGMFITPFFGPAYDRLRGLYALDITDTLSYVYDGFPVEFATVRGIYGQASTTLGNILFVEAGYYMPWVEGEFVEELDEFHFVVSIPKGAIPLVDVSASLSYDKMAFVDGAKRGTFLDENAVLKGEIVYPIAPTMDLAGIVTTIATVDDEIHPVISIETRIHF